MLNDYFAAGSTGAPDPVSGERPKKLKYSVGGEWKKSATQTAATRCGAVICASSGRRLACPGAAGPWKWIPQSRARAIAF